MPLDGRTLCLGNTPPQHSLSVPCPQNKPLLRGVVLVLAHGLSGATFQEKKVRHCIARQPPYTRTEGIHALACILS